MLWPINNPEIAHDWLNFEPARVLYEYDGPRIFTCLDVTGEQFLAFYCGSDANVTRFLVVPFSATLEDRLVRGDMNLHDALTRPRAWIFDLDNQWNPTRCWAVSLDGLPTKLIPRPGVMLWPSLQSVMSMITNLPNTGNTFVRVSGRNLTAAGA